MLIGLDARTVYWPKRRGTGRNLIDLYSQVTRMRPDWRFVAYHRLGGDVLDVDPMPWAQARCIEMPGDRFDAWTRLRLPLQAWRDGVDVLHCPANLCPAWMPTPTVVTIHDLIPLDQTQNVEHDPVARRFRQSVAVATRRADCILCPSRYTADRLMDEFGADPARVTVNPWAPDSSMSPAPELTWSSVLRHYPIHRPYALHFGAPDPRKNTIGLIEAWATIKRKHRQQWQLVIVGLDGRSLAHVGEVVDRLRLGDSVSLHGFVEAADLPVLLTAATALAFPSLSEGFGLPILDAWATDTAVLTSDVTSLPEVAGDAAVLVDPEDRGMMAAGLTRLMHDPGLRRDLVEAGRRRLKRYTWRHTATRFIDAIESVVNAAPARQAA